MSIVFFQSFSNKILTGKKKDQIVLLYEQTTADIIDENIMIRIRKADRADIPYILKLYEQLDVENEKKLDIPSTEHIYDRISRYPDYSIYVAVAGKRIIGTFALLIMDNLAHSGAKSGIVEDVVVDSEFRDRGIGKQMMKYAMDECREKKCYKLLLSSNIKRKFAHKFYDSLGFKKHGYSFLINIENNVDYEFY